MADLAQLEARMKEIDQRIAPIANRTVDLSAFTKPGLAKALSESPLDRAKVRPETEALLAELVEIYQSSDDGVRDRIRAMFAENPSFDWAAKLPKISDARENFRRELLRLSMSDQGRDPRDLLVALEDKGREALAAGIDPAPIAAQVAGLSSDEDRYGMGSTRQILLNAADRWKTAAKQT